MATKIIMPRLTIDMEVGTVVRWIKSEGDRVEKGEAVCVVFGDKIEWEVEAPATGVLIRIAARAEAEVPIAQAIGWVGEPGEAIPDEAGASGTGPVATPEIRPEAAMSGTGVDVAGAPADAAAPSEPAAPVAGEVRASPAARRLAKEKGVDLSRLRGTGPGGRIVEADVSKAAASPPPAPSGAGAPAKRLRKSVHMAPMRKTIAKRMSKSAQTAPHFIVETEVDMTAARDLRRKTADPARGGKPSVSFNDILVAAVAKTIEAFETVNATLDGDEIRIWEDVNVGVAVHTEAGLVVFVVHGANRKSVTQISAEVRAVAERARQGKLAGRDVEGGTFTVTNLGMFGITRFLPIINPPESAILAVGEIVEKPVVLDGGIHVRPRMTLNLAVDHRVLDGAVAGQFLQKLKSLIEDPSSLPL